nr:hypothetical protein GZ9D8_8 [uncultured archaeon GZfos9D8]
MGSHAGESETEIFNRKIQDIDKVSLTFWLMKSHKAKPQMVQQLCLEANNKNTKIYCIFIEASSKGGAIPTKTASFAKSYSKDKLTWDVLPHGLSPVTGKIDDNAYALVFDQLERVDDVINFDLWMYANFFDENSPIKIIQGASTVCAVKKDMINHSDKIKSRSRKVIAVGRLCEPFCVYLK